MVMDKTFNILAEITPKNSLFPLICGIWTEIIGKRAIWWKHLGLNFFSIFATHPPAVSVFSVSCLKKKSLFHLNCFVLRKQGFAYCVEVRTWRTSDPAWFNIQQSITPWVTSRLASSMENLRKVNGENKHQRVIKSSLFLYSVVKEY